MSMRRQLQASGFHFKKKYGQNFISDQDLLRRIAALPTHRDTVLEIGAGAGTLTAALADHFARVVALEIDRDLEPVLGAALAGRGNVSLHFQDAAKTDFDALMRDAGCDGPYAVVANLPYYITTPLVMQLIDEAPAATEMVIMVQQEVAERFVSDPGRKSYGAVSVAVQYHCAVRLAMRVPRQAFTPAPAVDSAVLHLRRYDEKPFAAKDDAMFRRVVRGAFGQRRKTMRNALSAAGFPKEVCAAAADASGIDLGRRGETLSIPEFIALADAFYEGGDVH